ncbi:MAG: Prolyl oligopeptidase family [Sphingomonadales bacterium]|jgi:hypothetical protein|nr:Prolyl oligopeptidase family [Sphingomonadales bacterium]
MVCRNGLGATGLLAVAAGLVAAVSAIAETPVSPYPPVRLTSATPSVCNFDRIMLAPDGDRAVVWAGDKPHILATQVPPPFGNLMFVGFPARKAAASPSKHYYGPDLVLPIRFEGPRLWARATRNRILSIDGDSGAVEEHGALPSAFDKIDIRATTDGPLSPLESPTVVAAASRVGMEFIRANVTLGERATVFGVRAGDLSLIRLEEGGQSLLRASYTRRILAFPDARNFEGGLAYVGAPDRAGGEFLPYQLPIVDLSTGKVMGRFNGAEARLDGAEPNLAPLRRILAGGGALLDATYRKGNLAVLARLREGKLAALRINPDGLSRTDLCTVAPPAAVTPRLSIFGIDRSGAEAMRPGLPPAVLYRRPSGPARDLVIVFDGGPTGSLSDNYLPPEVARLMGSNRDVLAVDYAGSVGGGPQLTHRLIASGMPAIAEDVDALLRWLDRHPYRHVYLNGGSFGSIPAMIALKKARGRFAAAIFTVPLLKLRDPSEWAQQRPYERVSTSGQLAFEEAVFGGSDGRTRFATELSRLVASTPFGDRDRFFFGAQDLTSQAADLPVTARSHAITFRGGHHQTVGVREDYWREVAQVFLKE